MKCPHCVKEGRKSSVYPGAATTTLLAGSPGYWDEDGKWVPPEKRNTRTTPMHCSNGHHWIETEKVP